MMNQGQGVSPPIWVDTPASFRALLARLRGEPALAVDTESNSLYVYREQVCLIQISVPGNDYLVDPLALSDLSGLGPLFADPGVLKVLHGAEYDLSVLQRDYRFTLENLFDTMWASRILGWPAHGLAALLKAHFGVSLNKKYQRADWGRRPLPPEQLNYARLDTHYLLALHDIQAQELESTGRWPQAQHRFQKLTKARREQKAFDPDGFWRLPGARDLDDTGRAILRQLYLYREDRARSENRPPFKVFSNKAMVDLSERQPQGSKELVEIKGVSQRMVRKYGRGMLAAIRRGSGQSLSWSERPRPTRDPSGGSGGRPSAACQARFDALRTWRNATARNRGVEPDIVLTNQALWSVATNNPSTLAGLTGDGLLAPWQVEEFGSDLLAVAKSSR